MTAAPDPAGSGEHPSHPSHHERELAQWDVDGDGRITDTDLALAPVPSRWRRWGLRGPAIILRWFTRNAKRLAVLILGGAVLLSGVAMLVLPGPGVLIVVLGFAILATEFAWAERALDRTLGTASWAVGSVSSSRTGRGLLTLSAFFLVVTGVTVLLFLPSWRVAGGSIVLAGLIGLGTLHPRVQRWLAARQSA